MGLFRLGKLALAGDKDKQEEAPSAGLLSAAAAGSSGAAASAALSEPVGGKKKKPKDDVGASAPSVAEGRGGMPGAGSHTRPQAGLSVNDFISKTKQQQRQGLKPSGPELIAYARYLGIDPVADHDLLWIAVEALEAPLPSDWTEHFDSNDRVFYYNATTRVSSWTHPLEHIYRETYKTIVNFRNANMHPEERGRKLQDLQLEVKQMEQDVHREIAQWTEHTDEQNNRFYFNREERQSTWTDPRPAKCQILYLRIKMLSLLSPGNSSGGLGLDSKFGEGGMSRLGALPGSDSFDDPARKRSKQVGGFDEPLGRTSPSPHDSDSDSGDEGKKKKRKKKKKKKGKDHEGSPDAPPVRLGVPQKLGTSQSEPSVGKLGKDHDGMGGGAGPHSILSSFGEGDALSGVGRARVKAGIRLQPLAPGGPEEDDAHGPKVGSSASVPAL